MGDDGLKETERVEGRGFQGFGELKLRWRRLIQSPSLLPIRVAVTFAACSASLSLSLWFTGDKGLGFSILRPLIQVPCRCVESLSVTTNRTQMPAGHLRRTPSPSLCRLGRVSGLRVSEEDGEDDEQRRGIGVGVLG